MKNQKSSTLQPTKDPEIKIDPRTGIYFYRGTPKSGEKELKRSLGVRKYHSAVIAKKELLLKLRGIDPNAKDVFFSDYVKVFLEDQKRKAPATFELAFYSIKELLPFFESYTMRQITDAAWDEYKEYQTQINPTRLLRYDRRHLKMMLLKLKSKGKISEIPDLNLDERGPKKKRVLTQNEVKTILENSEGTVYGLALFMYFMGPRPMEVLGAPWSEFDLKKGIWSLPAQRTKTRQARAMKIAPKVLEFLLDQKSKSKSEWVFPARESQGKAHVEGYGKQWTRMINRTGLSKEITPYYLRHTFLTECAKKVMDGKLSLVLITKYAGTSIEQFEKTYLHIEGEDTKAVADLMELEV